MQQSQLISGFSELKDLLIRKYNITDARENIMLHFTISDGALVLHNYKRHYQQIELTERGTNFIGITLKDGSIAQQIVMSALKEKNPDVFLNQQFKLHGFYRF